MEVEDRLPGIGATGVQNVHTVGTEPIAHAASKQLRSFGAGSEIIRIDCM